MKNKFIMALLLSSTALYCSCAEEDKKPAIPTTSSSSQHTSQSTSSNIVISSSSSNSNGTQESSTSSSNKGSNSSSSQQSNQSTSSNIVISPSSSSSSSHISSSSSSSSSSQISSSSSSSSSQSSSSSSTPVEKPEERGWLTDNIQSNLPKATAIVPESIVINEENGSYTIAFAPANNDPLQPYKVYAYNSNNELVNGYPKIITNGGAISHFAEAGTYTIKIKTPGDYVNTQDSDFATSLKTINETAPTGVNEPECDYGNPLLTATHLTSPVGLEVKSNITGIEGHVVAFSEASVENATYFKAYAIDSKGKLVSGFPRTIKAGDSIPYFPVNGTYYVYVQAIGDDINYKNSPLTNGFAVTETNGTGVIAPTPVGENPEKTAIALGAPVGFVVNKNDLEDGTFNYVAAWANDDNASSYLAYVALADGTIISGYPTSIDNGGVVEISEEGTYYVYVQAIGDGTLYSNSALSTPVKLEIGAPSVTPEPDPDPTPTPNPEPDPDPTPTPNPNATIIDLSASTYVGGDLVELTFTPILDLTKDNIENLVMSGTNQNGTDVLANSLYNFNPVGGKWFIQLNSAGHSEIHVNFTFTYNGTNYAGSYSYVPSGNTDPIDPTPTPDPETPNLPEGAIALSVNRIECYGEWFMKVFIDLKGFTYDEIDFSTLQVSLSNNSAATLGEKFDYTVQEGRAMIRIDANERGAENKTTGTTFVATVTFSTTSGQLYTAIINVSNGNMASKKREYTFPLFLLQK